MTRSANRPPAAKISPRLLRLTTSKHTPSLKYALWLLIIKGCKNIGLVTPARATYRIACFISSREGDIEAKRGGEAFSSRATSVTRSSSNPLNRLQNIRN